MTTFKYIAISQSGERIFGQMDAKDRESVLSHLGGLGHIPVDAREASDASGAAGLFTRRPTHSDISTFTRELSWLVKAGLPLSRALEILAGEARTAELGRMIAHIRADIHKGKSFHEALGVFGRTFSPSYVSMIEVGETSGTLVHVLERIADGREREQRLQSKAISALLYPGLLVFIAVAAVIIIMIFVVPRFSDMIVESGAEIPESSRLLIALSNWILVYGWHLLGFFALVLPTFIYLLRRPAVRRFLNGIAARLPVFGYIMQLQLAVKFSRTLGMLLSAGVQLPKSLNLMKQVFEGHEVVDVLNEMDTALRKGQDFLVPLKSSTLFPSMMLNMLRVGAETGNMAPTALHIARICEQKFETAVERALTIIEPAIILTVSLLIAGVIISIMGAVLSINEVII